MGGPTLVDVARTAGVSHTTVSLALRGDARISRETTERVRAAVDRLGYVPNAAARALAQGRSWTIAVLSAGYTGPYLTETLRGMEEALFPSACGPEDGPWTLVHHSCGPDESRLDAILRDILLGNRADGVVCVDCLPSPRSVEAWHKTRKPLVTIHEEARTGLVLRSDSRAGTLAAADHLAACGVRRPCIVHGPVDGRGRPHCNPARLDAWREAAALRGWGVLALDVEDFTDRGGRACADRVASLGCDGVFCAAGDLVALGLVRGLADRGLGVPDQVQVVGYDDLPLASLFRPELTSVSQCMVCLGAQAVAWCRERASDYEGAPWPLVLPWEPELVVRQSTLSLPRA